jgi:hypothetical protein
MRGGGAGGREEEGGGGGADEEAGYLAGDAFVRSGRRAEAEARGGEVNKENPDAPPIVLEELTKEDRAALLQQEMEWTRKIEEVLRVQWEADRLAKEAEWARAPPPPPEDPSKDKWQLDYDFGREHLEMKLARERGFSGFSFEDNSKGYLNN